MSDYCEKYLIKSADDDTLLETMKIAETYNLKKLSVQLMDKFVDKAKFFVESSRFQKFAKMYPTLFTNIFKFWLRKSKFQLGPVIRATDEKPIDDRFEPQNEFSKNFGKMLTDERFSDVTFVVEDKEIKAHKVILSAQSTYFDAMFTHDTADSKNNSKIQVTDVASQDFIELIRFIYSKRVNDLKKSALGLFQAADKYNLLNLKEICAEYLKDNITDENVLDVLHFSKLHNHSSLEQSATSHLKNFIPTIVDCVNFDDFANGNVDILIEIFLEKIKNIEQPVQITIDAASPFANFLGFGSEETKNAIKGFTIGQARPSLVPVSNSSLDIGMSSLAIGSQSQASSSTNESGIVQQARLAFPQTKRTINRPQPSRRINFCD